MTQSNRIWLASLLTTWLPWSSQEWREHTSVQVGGQKRRGCPCKLFLIHCNYPVSLPLGGSCVKQSQWNPHSQLDGPVLSEQSWKQNVPNVYQPFPVNVWVTLSTGAHNCHVVTHPPICLSICLPNHLSICPSVHPSIHLSIHSSICPRICCPSRLSQSSIHLSIPLSDCTSICPKTRETPSVLPIPYKSQFDTMQWSSCSSTYYSHT